MLWHANGADRTGRLKLRRSPQEGSLECLRRDELALRNAGLRVPAHDALDHLANNGPVARNSELVNRNDPHDGAELLHQAHRILTIHHGSELQMLHEDG